VNDWWMNSFSMLHRRRTHRTELPGEVPVWMKIRIDPNQEEHAIIDRYLEKLAPADADFEFEKHESGPEVLVYLNLAAIFVTLATPVFGLIKTIIKARLETRKKREMPFEPVELIVRRIDEGHRRTEEIILRFGQRDASDETAIDQKLTEALREIAKDNEQQWN
jgi:hypothetical protein